MAKKPPVDPLTGPKLALTGRIVTMDDTFRTLDRGTVYIELGGIVAVQDAARPAPAGFENIRAVDVRGTIFPGLIELHNHLAYNALSLWHVPRLFTNRGQWGATGEYQRLVTGPMKVLGLTESVMPSLVRYVECKCLVSGVTTSQGIELFSNAGARRYYRGIVRNVEQTDQADLPEAVTRIADVDARSPERVPRPPQEADMSPAASERRRRPDGAEAFSRPATAGGRVGDYLGARGYPLRGAAQRGFPRSSAPATPQWFGRR